MRNTHSYYILNPHMYVFISVQYFRNGSAEASKELQHELLQNFPTPLRACGMCKYISENYLQYYTYVYILG